MKILKTDSKTVNESRKYRSCARVFAASIVLLLTSTAFKLSESQNSEAFFVLFLLPKNHKERTIG